MSEDTVKAPMVSFHAEDTSALDSYRLLTGGICPRPIALVSTLSPEGVANLAPFSFFNAFGANPPVVGFSATRSLRDGSLKDTYDNLRATEECVIQSVPFAIVEQVNLSAAEFPSQVSEWDKCGLTPLPSERVAPMRVAESPFQMECKLRQLVSLGDQPGAGNLFLCEVLVFHVAEDALTDGVLQGKLLGNVGRMGGNDYSLTSPSAIFPVARARHDLVIGFDRLPERVRESCFLTGNEISRLAVHDRVPSESDVAAFAAAQPALSASPAACGRYAEEGDYESAFRGARFLLAAGHPRARRLLERSVQVALRAGAAEFAWNALLWLETSTTGA